MATCVSLEALLEVVNGAVVEGGCPGTLCVVLDASPGPGDVSLGPLAPLAPLVLARLDDRYALCDGLSAPWARWPWLLCSPPSTVSPSVWSRAVSVFPPLACGILVAVCGDVARPHPCREAMCKPVLSC